MVNDKSVSLLNEAMHRVGLLKFLSSVASDDRIDATLALYDSFCTGFYVSDARVVHSRDGQFRGRVL